MLKEFKAFALRGSVVDLAIGVIIGSAFGKIVSSLVSDVIMPPLGLLMGKVDFGSLYINLSGTAYPSLAEAKKAGAATINYGVFINTMIDFVIIAFVIFLLIRQINRLSAPKVPAEPTTKECPFCLSASSLKGHSLSTLHIGTGEIREQHGS